jgi:hypothetical protein
MAVGGRPAPARPIQIRRDRSNADDIEQQQQGNKPAAGMTSLHYCFSHEWNFPLGCISLSGSLFMIAEF